MGTEGCCWVLAYGGCSKAEEKLVVVRHCCLSGFVGVSKNNAHRRWNRTYRRSLCLNVCGIARHAETRLVLNGPSVQALRGRVGPLKKAAAQRGVEEGQIFHGGHDFVGVVGACCL